MFLELLLDRAAVAKNYKKRDFSNFGGFQQFSGLSMLALSIGKVDQ